MRKQVLHLICDYAMGDLAWSEILDSLAELIEPDVRMIQTAVKSFDTIATGFVVAQLAMRPRKNMRVLVFANCAPRKDNSQARADNEGEGLVYAKLTNGVELLVVNSGYSLSFVKKHIVSLYRTKASSRGSQFRSRDNFPSVIARCLEITAGMEAYDFLDGELDVNSIPDMPERVVAYVDSFGNIKTSVQEGAPMLEGVEMGTRVRVLTGDKVRGATVTDGSFSVPEGDIAFAPGSSGWGTNFWELFKRGGEAVSEFGHPPTGTKIEIVK